MPAMSAHSAPRAIELHEGVSTGARLATFGPYVPATTTEGEVVFQATATSGESLVVHAGKTGVRERVRASVLGLTAVVSHPVLSEDGETLAFYGESADGGVAAYVVSREGTATRLSSPDFRPTEVGPLGPTVNVHGDVAFRARLPSGEHAVLVARRGRVACLVRTGGDLSAFRGLPVATDDGAVVVRADDDAGRGLVLVCRDDAPPVRVAREGEHGVRSLGNFPSARGERDILVAASFDDGASSGLRLGLGRAPSRALDDQEFSAVRGLLHGGPAGTVVLGARADETLGVYVGGARLVGLGDTLFGERVTDLAANPVSASGSRLAVRLAFHTGRESIVWT